MAKLIVSATHRKVVIHDRYFEEFIYSGAFDEFDDEQCEDCYGEHGYRKCGHPADEQGLEFDEAYDQMIKEIFG